MIKPGYDAEVVVFCECKGQTKHKRRLVMDFQRREASQNWVPVSDLDKTRKPEGFTYGLGFSTPAGLHSWPDAPSMDLDAALRQTSTLKCRCGNNVPFAHLSDLHAVLDQLAEAGIPEITLDGIRYAYRQMTARHPTRGQ